MTPLVTTWLGQKLSDLSKQELIEALEYAVKEIEKLRQDRDRWRKSGDPLKYLMEGK